jgi:hypothetical protein
MCVNTRLYLRISLDMDEGFVYRFISTGTIEEKIFQRQANKQALSSAVVDEKEDAERHFSLDALRQLFLFNENTLSETHETFKCKRCEGGKQKVKAPALLYGDGSTYVFTSHPLSLMIDRVIDGITSQMPSSKTTMMISCARKSGCQKSPSSFSTSVIRQQWLIMNVSVLVSMTAVGISPLALGRSLIVHALYKNKCDCLHWMTSSQSVHSPPACRTLTFSPDGPKYDALNQAFISSSL